MILFNKADVYMGYSMAEVNMVLDALSAAGIKYDWKTGGDFAGWGASRSHLGVIGAQGQDRFGNSIS